MNVQFTFLEPFFVWEGTWYLLNKRLGEAVSQYGHCIEEKNILFLHRLEYRIVKLSVILMYINSQNTAVYSGISYQ